MFRYTRPRGLRHTSHAHTLPPCFRPQPPSPLRSAAHTRFYRQPPRPQRPQPEPPTSPEASKEDFSRIGKFDHIGEFHSVQDYQLYGNRVRFLRPALWALGVSAGIFALLAYLRAKEELKPAPFFAPQFRTQRQTPPTPTQVALHAWNRLDPVGQLSVGIIATNAAVHLGEKLVPRASTGHLLWHVPVRPVNYTLLTSMFVHSGGFHLLFNMWACYNFLPPVGYSKLFRGDTHHLLSFFLSAGVLSAYAQHVASAVFRQPGLREVYARHGASLYAVGRRLANIYTPGGGASGALFAIFGVFCAQYPQHVVGIVFLPFSFEAQYFLPAIMAFDIVGMVRGFEFARLGHAAHLGGAALGVAYSYIDGYNRVWRPLVEFWKRRLASRS